jgi:hypothetical protein
MPFPKNFDKLIEDNDRSLGALAIIDRSPPAQLYLDAVAPDRRAEALLGLTEGLMERQGAKCESVGASIVAAERIRLGLAEDV